MLIERRKKLSTRLASPINNHGIRCIFHGLSFLFTYIYNLIYSLAWSWTLPWIAHSIYQLLILSSAINGDQFEVHCIESERQPCLLRFKQVHAAWSTFPAFPHWFFLLHIHIKSHLHSKYSKNAMKEKHIKILRETHKCLETFM